MAEALAQAEAPRDLAAQVRAKNREVYDEAGDSVWRLVVYEAAHGGWELINLGGRELLDTIAARAALGPSSRALELCSGHGGTCRYLAQQTGCAVTGVEMNPRQVERARAAVAALEPDLARRLRFVEADVLTWQDRGQYDAVFSLDSLMLIPDSAAFFHRAFESLAPGGWWLMAAIVAGPAVTAELRDFAWEVDGMINLPDPELYRELAREAGFEQIELEDRTDLALATSEAIDAALHRHRREIEDLQGEGAWRGWKEVGDVYHQAFRDGGLAYLVLTARRA